MMVAHSPATHSGEEGYDPCDDGGDNRGDCGSPRGVLRASGDPQALSVGGFHPSFALGLSGRTFNSGGIKRPLLCDPLSANDVLERVGVGRAGKLELNLGDAERFTLSANLLAPQGLGRGKFGIFGVGHPTILTHPRSESIA